MPSAVKERSRLYNLDGIYDVRDNSAFSFMRRAPHLHVHTKAYRIYLPFGPLYELPYPPSITHLHNLQGE